MCHFRLSELNEDGHAYIRRGLREERAAAAGMPGMVMGSRDGAKAPVASSERPLGEALPLDWQKYFTVMGHHTFEAHGHEKAAFDAGTIDGWIGGPLDPHWSGLANLAFDVQAGGAAVGARAPRSGSPGGAARRKAAETEDGRPERAPASCATGMRR